MERAEMRFRFTGAGLSAFSMLAVFGSAFVAAGDAVAQEAPEPSVPLLTAVTGVFTRDIDTSSPLAQAYFDQGLHAPHRDPVVRGGATARSELCRVLLG